MDESSIALLAMFLTLAADKTSEWWFGGPLFDDIEFLLIWIMFILFAIMFILEEQNDEENDSA